VSQLNFDSLTASPELKQHWCNLTDWRRKETDRSLDPLDLAARWGAQYAAEKLASPPLTPEQQEALAALDRLLQHCTDNTGEAALRRFILGEAR
jgi:hypothetical protein